MPIKDTLNAADNVNKERTMSSLRPVDLAVIFFMCILSISALPHVSLASGAPQIMIVLDGSGSMWGQIDNKPKITIARETLDQVIEGIPPTAEIGLIVYGHRKKGDCSDIETIVKPAPAQGERIKKAVAALAPKGKTPLAESVKIAAEQLRYTEEQATVVLITDGLETCNAEPCLLAAELERLGVDFTTHVVGFGLTDEEGKQVACLAEATGGLYLAADNAEELVEALDIAVAEAAPQKEEVVNLPVASLQAENIIKQASRFTISWEGPGGRYDAVQLVYVDKQYSTEKVIRSKQVRQGDIDNKKVTLTAPADLGMFELRYYEGRLRKVLAVRPIEVVAAEVALQAAESVEIGKTIFVEWQGPGGRYDTIEIFTAKSVDGAGKVMRKKFLRNDDFENRKVSLTAPAEPGDYLLRYWNGENRKVLATRTFEVIATEVLLKAPQSVNAGKGITIQWQGPGGKYDNIVLFDPQGNNGEGKEIRNKRLRNDDYENRTVSLTAPVKPGIYELRYWNGENRRILASTSIEVLATDVWVKAPASIEAGKRIAIEWQGPGGKYDSIILYDPKGNNGEGKEIRAKRLRNDDYDNRRASLTGPVKPGEYELRYWNGENKTFLATVNIEIVEGQVGLDFTHEVKQAERVVVTWKGPGGRYDDIQIFDPAGNNGEGKIVHKKRLRNDDFDNHKASLPAPAKEGEYLIRYWNGENKAVLVTAPLKVVANSISLEVVGELVSGQKIVVAWTGPGARYDSIDVINNAGKKLSGQRLRNGDFDNRKVSFTLPKAPGKYQLRYWNGDNKVVMASKDIEVK